MWQYLNQVVDAENKSTRDIAQLNRDIKRILDSNKLGFELYPFKIYVLPDVFRGTTTPSATNWRTVRVRGGYVLTEQVATGSIVNGCDGFQEYAYANTVDNYTTGSDILVDANTFWWFWIEETSSSYYNLRYGSNPTASSVGNPNPWTGFPTADAQHIPIGYVDSATSASQNQLLIRNLIDSDVVIKGGGSISWQYWNYSGSFPQGTIVYVDPNATYPGLSFYPTSGSTAPPLSAGWYVTLFGIPNSGSRTAGEYYYPFFPTWSGSHEVTVSGSVHNRIYYGSLTPLGPGYGCDSSGNTIAGFGLFIPSGSAAQFQYSLPY